MRLSIAIAGAGIGGLAAAVLLRADGHEVAVYDQFEHPAPVGSGLVIQPVGQAVLDKIGIGAAVLAQGQPIRRMQGHEASSGRTVLDVCYDRSAGERFGLAVHRATLFDALYAAAKASGAQICPGHRIETAVAGRLVFTGGSRSGPHDLVIDAAGAGSILSPLKGRALPYGAVWGTVDWPRAAPFAEDRLTQCYRRADRMMGVLPVGRVPGSGGRKATVFWSLPEDGHDAWRAQPLDQWKADAARLWPDFAIMLQEITDHRQMTMARYTHGTLTRPWSDGLVHIGDAAHRASPQLGQGANMALLDAYALRPALRLAEGREALALYARLRRWHVWAYQGLSWAFTPQYQSDSRVLPVLRDRVLSPLSRTWPLPGILSRLVCGDLLQPYAGLAD